MKESPQFSEALSKLRDVAIPTCRDARLLDACDRFCDLWLEMKRLQRERPRGFKGAVERSMKEMLALMFEITRADALTGMGRDGKLRCIQCLLDEENALCQLIGSLVADYGRPGQHNRIQLF